MAIKKIRLEIRRCAVRRWALLWDVRGPPALNFCHIHLEDLTFNFKRFVARNLFNITHYSIPPLRDWPAGPLLRLFLFL